MAESMNECTVCLVQFNSYDELRKHSFKFQSEIAILLTRLQSLIAHHWPTQNPGQEADHTGNSGNGEEPSGSCDDATYCCPHEDCAQQTATFEREQELIRHYGKHCVCNEYCLPCGNVFTRANKFWQHKCATKSPTEHIRKRKKILRDMAKDQLVTASQRKKGAMAPPNAYNAKRSRRTDVADTGGRPGTGSFGIQLVRGAGQEQGATDASPESIDNAQNACVSVNNMPPAGASLNQAPLWPSGYCDPNFHARSNPIFTPLWPEEMPANNSANLLGSIYSDTPSTLYTVPPQVTDMFLQPPEDFPDHTRL